MIDPTHHPQQAGERFREARAFFNNGEFFRSYDLATDAMTQWPDEVRFPHLAVLSLANAGATELALEKFTAFQLHRSNDMDVRALLGRLKKDQGFAVSGNERQRWLREALEIYTEAYATALAEGDTNAYYPGINAAALALWTGNVEQARLRAREVLDSLTIGEGKPDGSYWPLATRLEALLILGELSGAEQMTTDLLRQGSGQFAQIATTGRQLRRIAQSIGIAPLFLRLFTPPSVIHYTGHIIAAPGQPGRFEIQQEAEVRRKIDELLAAENVGSGYGALAAGADILFAESLIARGAALHLVLPFATPDFLEKSVRPSGPTWVARFEVCLAAAQSVRFATEDSFLDDESLFGYASQLGMGLAILAARHMQAPVLQIAVWDGEARGGVAGAVAHMKTWLEAKLPQRIVRCGSRTHSDDLTHFKPPEISGAGRRICAMAFGDVHGFSKLNDRELPVFAREIMGRIGAVTKSYHDCLSFVNTWGDGVFAVFAEAGKAADWALELQKAMHEMDLQTAGLPLHLKLRLGGHLGPAYELLDPVVERMNYYGAHVSRAARIEPVTPEGCVYVTETFAALLALKCPAEFACDYVGYTEMAKHYGRFRMFLLRRASASSGPAVLGDIERAPLKLQT